MKKIIVKRLLSVLLIVYIIFGSTEIYNCFGSQFNGEDTITDSTALSLSMKTNTNENSGELDFIKSKNTENTVFTTNKIMLYGGILLISVSAIGIIFTIMPKGKKKGNRIRKKDSATHVSNYSRGKRGRHL